MVGLVLMVFPFGIEKSVGNDPMTRGFPEWYSHRLWEIATFALIGLLVYVFVNATNERGDRTILLSLVASFIWMLGRAAVNATRPYPQSLLFASVWLGAGMLVIAVALHVAAVEPIQQEPLGELNDYVTDRSSETDGDLGGRAHLGADLDSPNQL